MSLWTAIVDVATTVAADAAAGLPVTGGGTLAAQAKILGFTATTLGAEADAVSHNEDVVIVLGAVLVGVAAVALLPEAALAAAVTPVVTATLPAFGGAISEAALASLIGGVFEVGLAGIAESVAEPVLSGMVNLIDDYGWALQNPGAIRDELPPWLQDALTQFDATPPSSPLVVDLDGDGVELTMTLTPNGTHS
jgi:hypothetical protein